MNVLELRDVSIIYQNTKEAVKHVSFAVPEGKLLPSSGNPEAASQRSSVLPSDCCPQAESWHRDRSFLVKKIWRR